MVRATDRAWHVLFVNIESPDSTDSTSTIRTTVINQSTTTIFNITCSSTIVRYFTGIPTLPPCQPEAVAKVSSTWPNDQPPRL